MTINYTTLLALAKPVTGTETGQWGDVVNDQITSMLEDAIANAATFSVTSGNVTLTTANGSTSQARMSTLIITGTPGTTRNVIAPSQAKIYVVINQSNGAVVIKGAATTGVTVGAGQTAQIAWNGSDFVEIGNYVHGNFVINGNLTVNGNTTLGDAAADNITFNGTITSHLLFTDNTYDIGASGATRPRNLFLAGNATIGGNTTMTGTLTVDSTTDSSSTTTGSIQTDGGVGVAKALYVGTTANIAGAVTLSGGTANGVAYLNGSKVLTTGSALTFDGSLLNTTGSIRAQNSLFVYGTGDRLNVFPQTAGSGVQLVSTNNANSAYAPLTLDGSATIFNASGGEQMRLTSTGLGIGTSSPTAKLDVKKTSNDTISRTNAVGGFGDWDSLGAGLLMQQTLSSPYGFALQAANAANSVQFPLLLNPSGGNVGIGTSSPAYKLAVQGSAYITSTVGIGTTPGNYGGQVDIYANSNAVFNGIWVRNDSSGASANAGIVINASGNSWRMAMGSTANNNNALFWAVDAGSPTTLMTLSTSGNLGLGVTPSATNTSFRAFEVGSFTVFSGTGGLSSYIDNNAFFNTSSQYIYKSSGHAGEYAMLTSDGSHRWYIAPSGTAGNAITFTQAMTLGANGNLAVGDTSTGNARLFSYISDASLAAINARQDGAGPIQVWNSGGTERARIDSSGNLLVGTTSQPAFATSRAVVAYGNADYAFAVVNSNADPYGMAMGYTGAAPNSTSNAFFYCQDSGSTQRFSVRSNGGVYNYSANDINLSDRREKTNFVPAKSYLETICAIPVQTFNYIDQNMEEDPGLTLGVVAQDVQAVAPELVTESNWGSKDDPKMRLSIYQTDLQYALMKCIQELKAEVDSLKSQLKGA